MKQNSQNFANQNKTSSKDQRENPGSAGIEASKNRPIQNSNSEDKNSGNK